MSDEWRHRPVLLEEAVDALAVRPDGVYVDCTFGRGGHSRLILSRLNGNGRLYALDRDPEAVAVARGIADARFHITHSGFGRLAECLDAVGVRAVDGMLFDLGVSSDQIDEAGRGFSFRRDGPLDMRMDTSSGETAAEWLAHAPEEEIREVVRDYGEERFAKQVARAIVAARSRGNIGTTRELAEIVATAVRTREPGQDPATRTFQAIRIHVNQELEELALALPRSLPLLKPHGRLVVISFHSLEDRLVKRFMRDAATPDVPLDLPLRASEMPVPPLSLVGRAVRASAAEVGENPRARSAIMRVAERTEQPM